MKRNGVIALLRPTATDVKPMENFRLLVTFDNKEVRIFDVKPYITGKWYGELGNQAYFKSVMVDGFTVVWPNGQDICPDDLYYMGENVNNDTV